MFYKAAERARAEYPFHDWLHLTALIHDLGKVMAFYGEPQWAVVGDTFPVGCKWSEQIVFRNQTFDDNPDGDNEIYNTTLGIYKKNCGIENLIMSWGHDVSIYHTAIDFLWSMEYAYGSFPRLTPVQYRFYLETSEALASEFAWVFYRLK